MSERDLYLNPTPISHAPASLNALFTSSNGVAFSLELDKILSATCRNAVDLLKVDHSGLMVFDTARENGHVVSEYPPIGTKGLTIPLRGVPAEEKMVSLKEPIVVRDISLDPSFSPVSDILREHGIQSVLVVPLISEGRLLGSLGLDVIGRVRDFTQEEIKLCQAFAAQAAAVIELYVQNKQREEQLAVAQEAVRAFLNTQEDLKSFLNTITSQAVQLVGATDGGISQFHPERGELTVISDYRYPQFIGTTIKSVEGLAGHVLRDDRDYMAVEDYDKYMGKAPVFAKTDRFGAVLMINLKWRNSTVGVLYINAAKGFRFTEPLPSRLMLLAGTAAMAIANSHLLYKVEAARARILSSYETASALAKPPTSEQVLQDIARQALRAAGAKQVRLIVIDEFGSISNFIAACDGELHWANNRIRNNGISMRVLKTSEPYLCEDLNKTADDINPAMKEDNSRAAMCLPLSSRGRNLGVLWFHYPEPRKFSSADVDALTTYLKQAAIAYENTRQLEELDPLLDAAEGVAAAGTTDEVLQSIVKGARKVLHADYAILWPYEKVVNMSPRGLRVSEAVTDGVDEALREEMSDVILPVGDITHRAMEGRIGITDIEDPSPHTLPEVSLQLLRRLGAVSFEGLGLNASGEPMGVLYLVYRQRREFRPEETHRARTFAFHAAVALQKDKLLRQIAKDQRAAWEFTELVALRDLKETLRSFVEHTKKEMSCDAVTLFIYNDATERILPLTTMTGVRYEKEASHCSNAPPTSIVYKMLRLKEPYRCVSPVAGHELFGEQRFVQREGIEAVCAVPLKAKEHRVGVMFLNYRAPHDFTEAELGKIPLLANQVAVAIHNGLLYGEQLRFVELSKLLLGARDREGALEHAVTNAAEALGADFVAIVLRDEDGRPRFKAWKGWTAEDVQAYDRGNVEDYQTGFTIKHGEPIFITDYAMEKRFEVPDIITSKGVKSGLSVPMFYGDEPVGAMLVHFLTPRKLTRMKGWTGTLSLIANLTAIYVKTIASKIASLEAVQRASDEISRIRIDTDQSEVLERLVEQAVACLPQAFIGTIQLYDEKRHELRFESVFSRDSYDRIPNLLNERRPLVRRAEGGAYQGKIGIAGRAVLDKAPQLIDDVELDSDYYRYSSETRSELAVPLLTDDNRVLGVLNVESKSRAAFSKDDEQAMMALAKLVVATIEKADQYRRSEGAEPLRRLEETERLVNSSTTLAWLGMASSIWGHSVAGHALDIRDNLELLRAKLGRYDLQPEVKKLLDDKLGFIDELARQIRQKPITALLSYDAAPEEVSINWLIAERVGELRGDSRYRPVVFDLRLTGEEPRVRCSPDWIRKMLDILIDNAVDAMAGAPPLRLTITTRVVGNKVEIVFRDTGPGIPPEIKHKLFRQRVEKTAGSKGLGIGLLMVQAIAQTYSGEARVGASPEGATIYVRLPVVELPGVERA